MLGTNYTRGRGVALILVLMLVSVLGLLLLEQSLDTKFRVARGKALSDRLSALLEVRTLQAELAYYMLTMDLVQTTNTGGPPQSFELPAWNFYGEPFKFRRATVTVQDIGGLFVMPQRARDADDVKILLERGLKLDPSRSDSIVGRLRARMNDPTWIALQSFGDGDLGAELDARERQWLARYATVAAGASFNPFTTPKRLFPVWYEGSLLSAMLSLRERNELDGSAYEKLVGPIDEFVATYPGPRFRVEISVSVGETRVVQSSEWLVDPYAEDPFKVSFTTSNGSGEVDVVP